MPVYIDVSGDSATVASDLATISGWDDGLAVDTTTGDVSYFPQNIGFGPNRLRDIINLVVTKKMDIALLGADASYVLSDGSVLSQHAGDTSLDPTSSKIMRIAYDTTQCQGDGYYAYSYNDQKTGFAGPLILFHELSHAYHYMKGDLPQSTADAQAQAISDEDELRTEYQLVDWLPIRDPSNDQIGCGWGTWGNVGCYIATAACGSPYAPEVARLRHVRDFVVRRSRLGRAFFDCFFAEYYQFSPYLARDIVRSEPFADWLRTFLVAPLVEMFALLDECANGIPPALARRSGPVNAPCHRGAGLSRDAIRSMCARLDRLRSLLVSAERGREPPLDVPETCSADSVFDYLDSVVLARAQPRSTFAAWAVVDPVRIYWHGLARRLPGSDDETRCWIDELEAWLGESPVPRSFAGLPEDQAENALRELLESVIRPPPSRERYLGRLLKEVSGHTAYDLGRLVRRIAASLRAPVDTPS